MIKNWDLIQVYAIELKSSIAYVPYLEVLVQFFIYKSCK